VSRLTFGYMGEVHNAPEVVGPWPYHFHGILITHYFPCSRMSLGEPRYRLALVGMKFDLAFEQLAFKWPNSYSKRELCKFCKACKSGFPLYSEVGPDASWRSHLRDPMEYINEQGDNLTYLARIPGWCVDLHRGDLMHIIYLGFGNHVLGSCIMELAKEGKWAGTNLRAKLLSAWTSCLHASRCQCVCSELLLLPGAGMLLCT
jgi:hypothetical protein